MARRIAAVVIAAVVGFLIGLAVDGAPPQRTVKDPGVGPHGSVPGVARGFARTERGAVAALLSHATALGDPRVLLDPRRRADVLSVVATPRYAATYTGRGAAALEATRRGPIGQSLAAGARTAYFGTPIAYRVVSYSATQALVEGWGVSVVGNADGVDPQATWGKTLTSLRWQNGDWRVDSVEAKDGPTPSLADGQTPSSPADFFARLDGLRGVRHAP